MFIIEFKMRTSQPSVISITYDRTKILSSHKISNVHIMYFYGSCINWTALTESFTSVTEPCFILK